VAAHGVEAAKSKSFFHARTGIARAGAFEHYVADAELAAAQCEQIDARHQEVPAQQDRGDRVVAAKGCNDREVFPLQQGHLALAAAPAGAVVTDESMSCERFRLWHGDHWTVPTQT
jgi:elongation factor P--beta-lysine ligase